MRTPAAFLLDFTLNSTVGEVAALPWRPARSDWRNKI